MYNDTLGIESTFLQPILHNTLKEQWVVHKLFSQF